MKSFQEIRDEWFYEGFMDDVKKEIENGEVYEILADTIMISNWTGIRKSQASHVKAIEKKGKHYIIKYDIKKKKTNQPIEDVDNKIWKKLIANKEIKKV